MLSSPVPTYKKHQFIFYNYALRLLFVAMSKINRPRADVKFFTMGLTFWKIHVRIHLSTFVAVFLYAEPVIKVQV